MARCLVVFNGSKILIRKQITTPTKITSWGKSCFQWFKDTNSKANHNELAAIEDEKRVVFNGSKILIRKQITTEIQIQAFVFLLFSMVQRY